MNRKSVCIMVVTSLILTASGCNDTHDKDQQAIHLLSTEPSDNGTIIIGSVMHISIRLFFDLPPRSVTINGTKAKIGGNTAKWEVWLKDDEFFDWETGRATLFIAWVNPDDSSGDGAVITIHVIVDDGYGPTYVSGTFDDGDKNRAPNVLNRDGIVMVFNEPVITSSLVLAQGESWFENRSLSWTQTVEDKTVRFERLNGEPLQFNQTYIIYGSLTDKYDNESHMLFVFTTKENNH